MERNYDVLKKKRYKVSSITSRSWIGDSSRINPNLHPRKLPVTSFVDPGMKLDSSFTSTASLSGVTYNIKFDMKGLPVVRKCEYPYHYK